ncbi:MAG TPA: hypothetical protein VM689_21030 [Aliidongia sp.]|nr:hypothetical protein [Aliidongia sp.]
MARAPSGLLAWTATAMAAVSLALVVVNGAMFTSNQSAQAEVNNRQQFINQSVQIARVEEGLAKALAAVATNGDDKVRDLLAEQGITYTVTPPAGK